MFYWSGNGPTDVDTVETPYAASGTVTLLFLSTFVSSGVCCSFVFRNKNINEASRSQFQAFKGGAL